MAITTTKTSGLAALIQSAMQQRLEENLRAGLPFVVPDGAYIPATHQTGTSSFTFISVADIPQDGQTLAEGIPPTPNELAPDHEAFGGVQMGRTVQVSDLAEWESPVSLVSAAVERLARNASEELNVIARKAWEASTNIVRVDGATSDIGASATVTANDIRKMFAYLQSCNVPTFPDGLYRAVIHPRVAYDIQASAASDAAGSWVDVMKYAQPTQLLNNEIGAFAGFRFVSTSICTVGETAAAAGRDLLSSFLYGPECYALGDPETLQTYFYGFDGDKSDPLGQSAFAGWKAWWGAKLLTKGGERLAVLKSCATPLKVGEK